MIAANYRRFPEAMALQLVLVFGRPVWNTTRPSTRIGRALRQGQAAIVKATPQLVRWVKTATPQWFREQARRAKALAKKVQQAVASLVWDLSAEKVAPKGRAPIKRTSWAVLELLDDYDDTHHGQQAHPLFQAIETRSGSWHHIASGMQLRGATKTAIAQGWACVTQSAAARSVRLAR